MQVNWQLAVNTPSTLGESPFWHEAEQQLYWVDIAEKQICRSKPFSHQVEHWTVPSEPGCIAPIQGGGLIVALRDGVYTAQQWGANLILRSAALHDPKTTRFNDGKCDPQGRLWIGSLYEPRTTPAAMLYCLEGSTLHAQVEGLTVANGLAWSPDAGTLYWSDTRQHRIFQAEVKGAHITGPHRVFQQFDPPAADTPYGGRPDGAAVDSQGYYWVAMFEGQRLLRFSPQGELCADIATPVRCPTMPCFGGPDLKTLFLTTSRYQRSETELATQPLAGAIWSCRVEIAGLPVNPFSPL